MVFRSGLQAPYVPAGQGCRGVGNGCYHCGRIHLDLPDDELVTTSASLRLVMRLSRCGGRGPAN